MRNFVLAAFVGLWVSGSAQASITLLDEDFSSSSYATNSWTVGSNNWKFDSFLGDRFAEFHWDPPVFNYTSSLTSKILSASGYDNLQLDYDLKYAGWAKFTLEQFAVQVYDGSAWHQLAQYNNQGGDSYGNFPWTHGSFNISSYATDNLRVRFTASGAASENITGWYLDKVAVASVPEPSALALLGLGILGIRRRRR